MGMTVLVIDEKFPAYDEEKGELESVDASLVTCSGLDSGEVESLVPGADGIIVNLFPIDSRLIRLMKRCRIISRYGVGFDTVDVEAATKAGIWVANVQGYATEDVSDHAVALLLACVRKLPFRDREVRVGGWNLHNRQSSRRVKGKTLGMIGYGATGRAVARKMKGFELARILVWDPYIDREDIARGGGVPANRDEVFRQSDFVSIHAPLNDETRHMINKKSLSEMKPEAILINTSRGGLVDTNAVVKALRSHTIAYAGLDVFEQEPLPADSPLFELDNVILTDHSAWFTEESVVEMKTKTARNVAEVLAGRRPIYPVNWIG